MGGATGRWDGRVFCSGKKTQTVNSRKCFFHFVCSMSYDALYVGGGGLADRGLSRLVHAWYCGTGTAV